MKKSITFFFNLDYCLHFEITIFLNILFSWISCAPVLDKLVDLLWIHSIDHHSIHWSCYIQEATLKPHTPGKICGFLVLKITWKRFHHANQFCLQYWGTAAVKYPPLDTKQTWPQWKWKHLKFDYSTGRDFPQHCDYVSWCHKTKWPLLCGYFYREILDKVKFW